MQQLATNIWTIADESVLNDTSALVGGQSVLRGFLKDEIEVPVLQIN